VTFRPQFGAPKTLRPGTDVLPSYATVSIAYVTVWSCC